MNTTPMLGRVFGRLTVKSRDFSAPRGPLVYRCVCVCGGLKSTRGYSLRRGQVQSCGCIMHENAWDHPRKHASPEAAAWLYNWNQYQRNIKFRNLTMDLSFEEFQAICRRPCSYCGAPPEQRPSQRGRSSIFASGIDRVDNSKGYSPDNVVPCCTWCNRAKSSNTTEEFVMHCQKVANASVARHKELP